MHPDGSALHRLVSASDGLFSTQPFWSRDSDQLLFKRFTDSPDLVDLWSVNVDGSQLYQVTHQPAGVPGPRMAAIERPNGRATAARPAGSPDGASRLVFPSSTPTAHDGRAPDRATKVAIDMTRLLQALTLVLAAVMSAAGCGAPDRKQGRRSRGSRRPPDGELERRSRLQPGSRRTAQACRGTVERQRQDRDGLSGRRVRSPTRSSRSFAESRTAPTTSGSSALVSLTRSASATSRRSTRRC